MNAPSGYTWDGDVYCPEDLPVDENREDVSVIFPFNESSRVLDCIVCHGPVEACVVPDVEVVNG